MLDARGLIASAMVAAAVVAALRTGEVLVLHSAGSVWLVETSR